MYDKSECQTGIVHIGYGNFHRAHQAVYVDDYMQQTGDLRWGDIPKKYMTFTRDLKSILLSHTYEKEIDLLGD
jgi:hypothetical protein